MFGGSDEYVLREILENVDHMIDIHLDLNRNYLELEYANDLKEFELGIINENEFEQRKNGHYQARQQLLEKNRRIKNNF